MGLRDRFRRALHRSGQGSLSSTTRTSSVSESSSSQGSTSPPLQSTRTVSSTNRNLPMITLTKTSSRLSKRLTWRSDKDSEEEKERRRKEKEWQAFAPRQHHWLRMSKEREMMAGFEWKWKNSADGGRPNSIYSGISPCTSRPGSRDGRDLRKAPSNGDLNGGGREEGAVGGPAADE